MMIEQNRQTNQALLEALVRNSAPQGGGGAERRDDFSDFLRTQPPVFSRAEDPLDADHWLRTIEQKLALLQCEDHEKALFAAHQLQGPAGAWWSNFLAMHPADHRVTWAEFRAAFRSFHIPSGLMEAKRREFEDLKQGDRTVVEYVQVFNHLAQYAPEEVSTDAQKQRRFINGLCSKMKDRLSAHKFADFDELVSTSITVELNYKSHQEEKKRKRGSSPSVGGSSQRARTESQPPAVSGAGGWLPTPDVVRATSGFLRSTGAGCTTSRLPSERDRWLRRPVLQLRPCRPLLEGLPVSEAGSRGDCSAATAGSVGASVFAGDPRPQAWPSTPHRRRGGSGG